MTDIQRQEACRMIDTFGREYFKELDGRRVLITGANGMVMQAAAYIFLMLNSRYQYHIKVDVHGRNIDGLAEKYKNAGKKSNCEIVSFDLMNEIPWGGGEHYDVILAGASLAGADYFEKSPVDVILPNVFGVSQALEHARRTKGTVLFISSVSIYGETDQGVLKETDYGRIDPVAIHSCYDESKRLGEQLCVSYFRQYHADARVARIGYTYGPTYNLETDRRSMPGFIKTVREHKTVKMFRDLRPVQYTYVFDIAMGLITVLLKGTPGEVYNICDCETINLEEAVRLMYLAVGEKEKLEVVEDLKNYKFKSDKKFTRISNDKLCSLGWRNTTTYADGFEKTIENYLYHEHETRKV